MPHRRFRRLATILAAVTLATVSCKGVLEVSNEQDILDKNLDNPDAVVPIMNGVIGDYALAYANAIDIIGLFGQELQHTGSFPTWREVETGIGTRPSGTGDQVFQNVSRAIWVADTAAVRFRKFLPDAEKRFEVATVLMWGGFAHFLLADNFCEVTFHGGPAVTPKQGYERAKSLLEDAVKVATAANRADVLRGSYGGLARVKLMLGDYAGARSDARQVPQGFRLVALYGNNTRENNGVAINTTTLIRREAGVHPRFYNDSRFGGDPRTMFRDKGDTAKGPDPTRKFVEQLKYPARDTPIPVFTWQEARLIEAEAELQLGNPDGAVTLINQVRAASSIAAYSGPVTAAAVRAQLIYERQAELWLQAQSLNDWRRFNLQFATQPRDKCFEIGQLEFDTNPNLRKAS
ncbi:MAG: RagB/SusD family nutrient uptake outer membrane protein [Gemmatimonadaceae bacterium]